MSFSGTPGWFALTTRPNHEHAATRGLSNQGLETYLPVYRSRKRWSDRVRESDAVLFPGYVFCRFGLREFIGSVLSLCVPGTPYDSPDMVGQCILESNAFKE